jgi:hypothetical protein
MDAGGVGLLAFLAVVGLFYYVTMTNLRQAQRRHDQALWAALLGSVSAYLVQAQFNPDIIVTRVVFWLAVALAVAVPNYGTATKPPCERTPRESFRV